MTGKDKTPANWEDTYSRLEAANRALEHGWELTTEEKKKILRERAAELSKEAHLEEGGESVEVVEFIVAYERYGVESSYVIEVFPMKDITPLPGTPSFITGIVNVRGRIISVVDIKKFFDLPQKGLGDFNKLVIISSGTMEFGLLADSIVGTRKIRTNELQPSLPTLTGIREEYLRGILQDRSVILDAGRLLSDKKLIVHDHIIEE